LFFFFVVGLVGLGEEWRGRDCRLVSPKPTLTISN
jgi:hypothetical protein